MITRPLGEIQNKHSTRLGRHTKGRLLVLYLEKFAKNSGKLISKLVDLQRFVSVKKK